MCRNCAFSSRNSPQQSAIAKGFVKAISVFIVITSAKIMLRWLFPSKIYIQFKMFNIYFSTKLLFTSKRYHLHVLEKCLYVLWEVRSIIYFRQFIHPPCLMFLILSSILYFSGLEQNATESWVHAQMFSYDLVRKKKENAKVLTYALDNIGIFFVILWLC